MVVDVVIIASDRTPELHKMTRDSIKSLHESETDIEFNVILIENGVIGSTHLNEFNYNAYMNHGISLGTADYVCLCNNDLIYSQGWASNIISAMEAYTLLSASPLCSRSNTGIYAPVVPVQLGYRLRHELNGWCIMLERSIFNAIDKLNEDYPFWFADNRYAEQIKSHGIRHALVSSSRVTHLGSQTLSTIDAVTHYDLTKKWIDKWCAEFPDNDTTLYFKEHGY